MKSQVIEIRKNNEHLQSIVDRIERLEADISASRMDLKEIYIEAKGNGFDTRTLREMIRLRKLETSDLQEREALRTLYAEQLDLF